MPKSRSKEGRYTSTTVRFDREDPKDRERLKLIDESLISKNNLIKYALDQLIKQIKEGNFLEDTLIKTTRENDSDMTVIKQDNQVEKSNTINKKEKVKLDKGFKAFSDEDF